MRPPSSMHGAIADGTGAAQARSDDATSWHARHRVHAPSWSMRCTTSVTLLAPKATAGFMHGVRPVSKQCVHRYNFFMGSMPAVVFAFCCSRDLTSASALFRSSSPRNFLNRTCGPVGGPRVKSSRGKGRNSHTLFGSLARESMTYPATWVASVGCSTSSLVTKSTKAASTD